MDFSNAQDFGDVIAIAYDLYDQIKSTESVSADDEIHQFLYKGLASVDVSHPNFSFLDSAFKQQSSEEGKRLFLYSLLSAVNDVGPFDEIALKKSGLLSSLFTEKMLVLPMQGNRFSYYWETKGDLRDIHNRTKPEDAFSFFSIVRRDKLLISPSFSSLNYEGSSPYFNILTNKASLHVVAVPFFNDNLSEYFEIELDDKHHKFSIKDAKTSSDYLTRYRSSFLKAIDSHPDLVIFPEMSLTKESIAAGQEILSQACLSSHVLIVAGSVWKDKSNRSFVLDHLGKVVLSQSKFTRFRYEPGQPKDFYIEGIAFDDRPPTLISILEVKGLGRVAVFICKDALERAVIDNITSCLYLDLMIVIAYSPSFEIERDLDSIAKECHTTVCLVNACFGKKQQAKVFVPAKKLKRSAVKEKDFGPCEKRDCAKSCSGRRITIDI